jgi:pimeloyl-ACP methyl ester carboxylesterase
VTPEVAPTGATLATFPSFDGSEIAYLDEGTGPLAVLLHGFGSEHRENWVDTGVVAGLVGAGRRVVAWDARGHGASAKPHDPAGFAGNAMVRDAGALLDHLGVTSPRSVDVVGYSMGSVVASRWVPGDVRVRSLVLGGVGDNIANGAREAVKGRVAPVLLAESPAEVPDDRLWQMRSSLADKGNDLRSLAALDTAGQDDPTPAQLAAMGVPTLVLTGAEDWFVGPPDALAARIPGAVVRTMPGDHLTACDTPAFAAAIVEFVTAPTPPSEDTAP